MATRKLWTTLLAVATLSVFLATSAPSATASTEAGEAVEALERAGILAGTNCSTEACDGDLLRWEAALWLAKALELEPDQTVLVADVSAGTNLAGAVASIAREGVTLGCDTEPFRFCGDRHTTREEMASFLARAFDLRASRRAVFADVDRGSVHARSISTIHRAGITDGCDTEPLRFCPDDPISRRQAAVMLYRALQRGDANSGQGQGGSNTGNSGSSNSGSGNSGSSNSGSNGGPTRTPTPPSRPACPVVDRFNTHHDIDDHLGDPTGEISYALLPDGTLFGHRHDPGGGARCWMWAPPDKDGNGSNPVNVAPPSQSH